MGLFSRYCPAHFLLAALLAATLAAAPAEAAHRTAPDVAVHHHAHPAPVVAPLLSGHGSGGVLPPQASPCTAGVHCPRGGGITLPVDFTVVSPVTSPDLEV